MDWAIAVCLTVIDCGGIVCVRVGKALFMFLMRSSGVVGR